MNPGISTIFKNLYIIGIIYAVIALIIFPKWTVDDAYITYRYAYNLAEHGELTWNPGEDPIEGYTGITLPVIIALFIKIGISPVTAGKLIGVLCYFLSVWWMYRILQKLNVREEVLSLVMLLYLTCPLMFSIAWCGLETVPYIALLLACLNQLLSAALTKQPDSKKEIVLFLLLLLASLTRPEAAVFAFTSITALLAIRIKFNRNRLAGTIKRTLVFFILPGAVYFMWRWNYYGFFLPNTFYAKSSEQLLVKNSLVSFVFFALVFCFLPMLAAVTSNLGDIKNLKAYFGSGFLGREKTKLIYIGLSAALFCGVIILKYCGSVLKMNFESRFFAPYYPIFLIFTAVLLHTGFSALSSVRKIKPLRFGIIAGLLALFFAGQLFIHEKRLEKFIYLRWGYEKLMDDILIPIGETLKKEIPANEYIAVIYDAGAIPFYSQLKTIDFSRLNNEILAHRRPSPEELKQYFFSYNFAAVVISSYEYDKLSNVWYYGPEADIITSDPRFANYRLVNRYRAEVPPDNPTASYFEFLYVRSDLAARP